MSLDRDQDVVIDSDVDEDDMPPLVDNPAPTYTFFSRMTPLSFTSTSAPTATQDTSPQPSTSLISSLPPSPITPDASTSSFTIPMSHARPHGKRRDPSYIPRPPNAFILFRCAFIKEQNVPGKVEGNHSRLSKIIGLCWKQLTPEQREKWEAKAVLAQAEHRANYPDWRFRPGANALAKLKVKDGGGAVAARRRSVRSRTAKDQTTEDGEEGDVVGDTKGKGKAKAKTSRMLSIEETRCAKIAGFVAEGIKGEELEVAVKEWEGDHKMPKTNARAVKSKGRASQASNSGSLAASSQVKSRSITTYAKPSSDKSPEISPVSSQSSWTPSVDSNLKPSTSESPANSKISSAEPAANVAFQDVPLTHMFKRSLSAPASNIPPPNQQTSERSDTMVEEETSSRTSMEPSQGEWGTFKPLIVPQGPPTRTHNRRDTISFPMPSSSSSSAVFDPPHHLTWQEAESQRRMEELEGPDSWWSPRPTPTSSHFNFGEHKDQAVEENSPVRLTDSMGYATSQEGSSFDRAYIEHYGSFNHVQDGSQRVEWTNLSPANNRHGLVTVIEDPYKDDCNNNAPSIDSPPTLSLPPLSNSSYYHSPISPHTPPSIPSSSFSTLTGWAGDYKHNTSDVRTWPSDHAHTSSSSAWYTDEGTLSSWGTDRPELRHSHISIDSEDWDRVEYRASSDLRLQVQPPRQLDFMGELRRMHGGAT